MSAQLQRTQGFTLVELLIVVAVIAILVAIAVPNFLAAQVRAKVARAKGDIRTVVTALETYRVDHSAYPTYHYCDVPDPYNEFHLGGEVPGFGVPDPNWNGRNPLTSPSSYLSSMPDDPFCAHLRGLPEEVKEYLYVNWPYAMEQVQREPFHSRFVAAYQSYGAYRIHSLGPDLNGPDSGVPYDPTNGYVSDGDITYGPKTGLDFFIPFPW